MNCPGCSASMDTQTFAGNYGKSIVLDLCFPCGAMWFDGFENLQLTPGSILQLFKLIHEKRATPGSIFDKPLACPRCLVKLEHTRDMQRNTRFFYGRCPRSHGRFTTFFQFLREKSFVRDLTPKEVAELKQCIQMVHCSNCGASVDLTKDSTCPYCRSAISMLDPQQMEKTVRNLQRAEERRTTPGLRSPSVPQELEIARLFQISFGEKLSFGNQLLIEGAFDLVATGIEAAVSFFSDPG